MFAFTLDEVEGLGSFLEFEAVIASADQDAQGREQVAWLTAEFGIDRTIYWPARIATCCKSELNAAFPFWAAAL